MSDAMESEAATAAAERLTFFSDAVVAIAMTLLALELPFPEELTGDSDEQISEMLAFFGAHTNDYLAFLISFVVIAVHWSIHFRVFRYLRAASGRVVQLNVLWLLMIVITPFTTKIISLGVNNVLRFGIYAGAQALQFVIFALLVQQLRRGDMMRPGFDTARLGRTLSYVLPMAAAAAVSIPLYALIGSWAFWLWAVTPLATSVVNRLLARRSGSVRGSA